MCENKKKMVSNDFKVLLTESFQAGRIGFISYKIMSMYRNGKRIVYIRAEVKLTSACAELVQRACRSAVPLVPRFYKIRSLCRGITSYYAIDHEQVSRPGLSKILKRMQDWSFICELLDLHEAGRHSMWVLAWS